ncbi:MAG: SIMPL domain-containing protein [Candidatus Omnitrophica bacterium]|nr:SIMPL domain-containing protein [Candidatus Omnitrophota bacterium]MBI2173921.1 SIMPL domain-containing protein [Candidatus Omnitrophota bacterium]
MRYSVRIGLGCVMAVLMASSARAQEAGQSRLITVNGHAEVKVVPDEVILTLGVETRDKDLNVAKVSNDDRVKKIFEVAKRFEIDPKDVQTEHINIHPRYRDDDARSELLAYLVRKTVVITLRDLAKFEMLLSAALEAGANYVHGIDFRTTELRRHRDEARALAIHAAKDKAVALAGELGEIVGRAHAIREDQATWWSWYGQWGTQWAGNLMAQNVIPSPSADAGAEETTIAPGQITVAALVTIEFELQ